MSCRNAAPRYRLCHDGGPACKQLGRRADDEGDLASRDKGSDAGRGPDNERIPPKGNDRSASP